MFTPYIIFNKDKLEITAININRGKEKQLLSNEKKELLI